MSDFLESTKRAKDFITEALTDWQKDSLAKLQTYMEEFEAVGFETGIVDDGNYNEFYVIDPKTKETIRARKNYKGDYFFGPKERPKKTKVLC